LRCLDAVRLSGEAGFRHHVADVVPWVTVQALFQAALIEIMTNKTHATAEDKDAIQHANLNVLIGFLAGEAARRAKQVEKRAGNEAVHIQDQVRLFFSW